MKHFEGYGEQSFCGLLFGLHTCGAQAHSLNIFVSAGNISDNAFAKNYFFIFLELEFYSKKSLYNGHSAFHVPAA